MATMAMAIALFGVLWPLMVLAIPLFAVGPYITLYLTRLCLYWDFKYYFVL